MARFVANVDISTETFGNWVTKTSQLLDSLSTEILTANSTIANTGTIAAQRNARLYGNFAANTIVAETALRGGNTGAAANLNVTSNAVFTGASVNVASNSTFTANVTVTGANVFVNGTQLTSTSNTLFTAASQQLRSNSTVTAISIVGNSTATNTTVGGTTLNITSNGAITGSTLTSTANLTSTAASHQLASNSTVTAISIVGNSTATNTSIGGDTLNVSPASSFSNTVVITNTLASGNTTVTGFINVSSTANVAGSLQVGGIANVAGNTSIGGVATFQTDYVIDVFANTNLGSNTTAPQTIYSFAKASFKTAKFMVKAANTGGTNQIADMIVAHDETTPFITVFGVVPDSAPIGEFSVTSNTTHIILRMQQAEVNCKTTVVANLIK